jgi:uncharacterized protein YcfL
MKLRNIITAIALTAVSGCVETAGTRVTLDTNSGEASVYEGSTRLSNRIKIVRTTYNDAGDGIRKATVTMQSLSHKRQRLQARMIWLDAEGTEIDADGKPFRAIVLDGMDTVTFTGVATIEKAVTAKMVVRETYTAE